MYKLAITHADYERLLEHAEACWPLEAVALLFGRVQENKISVVTVELVDNAEISKTRFSVDPIVEYRLLMDAEDRGEDLVCIFHSHPAPPRPSSTDLQNMRLNPVVWLIASKLTGEWEVGAFIMDDEQEVNVVEIQIS